MSVDQSITEIWDVGVGARAGVSIAVSEGESANVCVIVSLSVGLSGITLIDVSFEWEHCSK